MARAAIIDTSRYQLMLNGAAVKAAGFCGIVARCTIGKKFDGSAVGKTLEYYLNSRAQARQNGMIFGGYHVIWPANRDPRGEADHYLANCGETDLDVLDTELTHGLPAAEVVEQCRIWAERVKTATGRAPEVYTGSWFWDGAGWVGAATPAGWERNYGLIEAEYTVQMPRGGVLPSQAPIGEPGDLSDGFQGWKFWQWTSSGKPYGMSADVSSVDYDVFNGTEEELRAYLSLGPKPITADEKLNRLWQAHPELHA